MKSKYHKLFPVLILFMSLSAVSCCKDNSEDHTYFMSNQDFVTLASAGNNFQIAASGLAAGKAETIAVSTYSQHIASNYSATQLQLTNVAAQKGLYLTNGMQQPLKDKFSKLGTLSGAEFDNEFALLMVQSHQDAVKLYESASQPMGIADADLRAFAISKLPTIKAELQDVLTLKASLHP